MKFALILVSLLSANSFAAAEQVCNLNGQVPIDFGNLGGLEDWHNEPDALYRPGVIVSRSQSQFGISNGHLYVGPSTRGNGKDWNFVGGLYHQFVFKDGKWRRMVSKGSEETFEDPSDSYPLAYNSRKAKDGLTDQVRVVAFMEVNGNRLFICPAERRQNNQAVNDMDVTNQEVNELSGAAISKKIRQQFKPNCLNQRTSIWPKQVTVNEFVVDVESLSTNNVFTIHVPREGEIKNETNKKGKKELLLDLSKAGHFVSDCKGIRRLDSAAAGESPSSASPSIDEKPK